MPRQTSMYKSLRPGGARPERARGGSAGVSSNVLSADFRIPITFAIDISQAVVPKNKARGLRVKRKRIVKKFLRVPPVLEYNYKKFVPSLDASKRQLFWTLKAIFELL